MRGQGCVKISLGTFLIGPIEANQAEEKAEVAAVTD